MHNKKVKTKIADILRLDIHSDYMDNVGKHI